MVAFRTQVLLALVLFPAATFDDDDDDDDDDEEAAALLLLLLPLSLPLLFNSNEYRTVKTLGTSLVSALNKET
jgi:hypothetical protein